MYINVPFILEDNIYHYINDPNVVHFSIQNISWTIELCLLVKYKSTFSIKYEIPLHESTYYFLKYFYILKYCLNRKVYNRKTYTLNHKFLIINREVLHELIHIFTIHIHITMSLPCIIHYKFQNIYSIFHTRLKKVQYQNSNNV